MRTDVPTWEEVLDEDVPELIPEHFALVERMPVEAAQDVDQFASDAMRLFEELIPQEHEPPEITRKVEKNFWDLF